MKLCRGATHSTVVLLDGEGKLLAEVDGPATNIWVMQLSFCFH